MHNRLEELQSARFASRPAPLTLIELISRLNNDLQKRVVKISKELKERVNRISDGNVTYVPLKFDEYDATSAVLRGYAYAIATLFTFLSLVESSRIEVVSPGITTSIGRIAREMKLNYPIILCPTYENTYTYDNILLSGGENSLRSDTLLRLFPAELFTGFPDHFPVLKFPFVIRSETLCHSLLFHELGHFISEVDPGYDTPLNALDLRKPLKGTYGRAKEIYREYLCDTIAVCLLGPAILFSIIEFITSITGLFEATQDHPPLVLRIRNILDTMKESGQWDFFTNDVSENSFMTPVKKLLEKFEQATDSGVDCPLDKIDEESRDIFDALKSPLEQARLLVLGQISEGLQFKPDGQLLEAVEKWIKNGIPPSANIANCKPMELATIINAGWIYRISFLQEPLILDEPLLKSQRSSKLMDLSRLIQTAVNQSETLQLYHQYE